MTVLKLGKYTGDDHCLTDESDAEFLRRKLVADALLDFSEVADVTAGFLDVLLENETPESIGTGSRERRLRSTQHWRAGLTAGRVL